MLTEELLRVSAGIERATEVRDAVAAALAIDRMKVGAETLLTPRAYEVVAKQLGLAAPFEQGMTALKVMQLVDNAAAAAKSAITDA